MLADATEADLNLVGNAKSPGRSYVAVNLAEVIFWVDDLRKSKLNKVIFEGFFYLLVRRNFADFLR